MDNLPLTRLSVTRFFDLVGKYGKNALTETMDDGHWYIGYDIGGHDIVNGRKKHYVYNHLTFSILYNDQEEQTFTKGFYMGEGMNIEATETETPKEEGYNIVGFQVLPCSVTQEKLNSDFFDPQNCQDYDKQYFQEGTEVQYSYSAFFQKTDISWSDRWQPFLYVRGKPMHWYSFLDSILIALLLAVLVASILLRTVRGDIRRYEQHAAGISGEIEAQNEETGWKLISGDVFRVPPKAQTLAMYVGSGFHVAICLMVSLALMTLGLISPVRRGALMTWILVTYFIMALAGGYLSTRYYIDISRGNESWRLLALKTGLFLPGITITILTLMNIVLGAAKSTQAVPFLPMFIIFIMWILLSVPLAFIGGYFASKKKPVEYPVRTNQIPREIVDRNTSWVGHPLLLIMLSGLLPFGVMYVDLYFIFTAMFENLYYYAFGFLFCMCIITTIVCMEMSIVSTYMTLCIEDYRWWWKSFLAGGSVALYYFLYGLSFLIFDSGLVGGLSAFVFLSYLGIMTLIIYLAMGALSFSVSYIFVRKIYAAIKAD